MMRIVPLSTATLVLVVASLCLADPVTSGLQVWLNADSLNLSNGAAVSAWNSTGPATVNATQGTAANQPTFVENAIHGHHAVRFDGGVGVAADGDFMSLGAITAGPAYTFFFALKADSAGPGNNVQTGFMRLNNADALSHYPFSDGNIYDGTGSTSRKSTGVPITPITQYHIYTVESAAGSWRSAFNGITQFSTTSNVATINASLGNLIGASDPVTAGNQRFFDGDIAEILIYNRLLTAEEYRSTGGYLGEKYNASFLPEPASALLMSIGAITLLRRRR